ncbi:MULTISPECIES: TetR/AcrR family transcriptional regulator [unclassified Ornithinimicrobium]|uniref:TetR/AcrR family transcriptional regulator n=1 Tax=unclassified Ornithinimicrobium TaxID=2615080 RepID=UPI00385391F0
MDQPGISTPERILRAALAVFGGHGYAAGSLRAIAQLASVSPALVLHHYGSKDGLRAACDARVLSYTDTKGQMLLSGSLPSAAALRDRHPEVDDALAYVVRAVTDGGPTSKDWYERWQSASADLLRELQKNGRVRADIDVEATAALLASFGFGVLGTQRLLSAHLGGDDLMADPAAAAYQRLSMTIFTGGLFTSEITVGDDLPAATET